MKKLSLLLLLATVTLAGCAIPNKYEDPTVTRHFSGTNLPDDPVLQQVRDLEHRKVLTDVRIAESFPVKITATGPEKILNCLSTPRGRWIQEQQECEQMEEQSCKTLGGQFNACASACRNQPNAEMCIQVCVPVCSFLK